MSETEWPRMRVAVPAVAAIASVIGFVVDGPGGAVFSAWLFVLIGFAIWGIAWAASSRSVGGGSA